MLAEEEEKAPAWDHGTVVRDLGRSADGVPRRVVT